MTGTSSPTVCNATCSPKGSSDPTCGCAGAKKPRKAKAAKYVTGFVALCAICCAVPAAFVGLGLISLATGAYLGNGLGAALITSAVLGLGYLLIQYVRKR